MKKELIDYISCPHNPEYNFALGNRYEEVGQLSAAISFYLRTAEYEIKPLLSYEALLRVALCFEVIGRRNYTHKGILLRAITIMPDRPEAYFLMARTYEINKDWHEAYAWSIIGRKIAANEIKEPLITNVQYPGEYGFIYEQAVVSWWIGLYYESLSLFKELDKDYEMLPPHKESVKNNIINVVNILKSKEKHN